MRDGMPDARPSQSDVSLKSRRTRRVRRVSSSKLISKITYFLRRSCSTQITLLFWLSIWRPDGTDITADPLIRKLGHTTLQRFISFFIQANVKSGAFVSFCPAVLRSQVRHRDRLPPQSIANRDRRTYLWWR